jgi:hypothetical protein
MCRETFTIASSRWTTPVPAEKEINIVGHIYSDDLSELCTVMDSLIISQWVSGSSAGTIPPTWAAEFLFRWFNGFDSKTITSRRTIVRRKANIQCRGFKS